MKNNAAVVFGTLRESTVSVPRIGLKLTFVLSFAGITVASEEGLMVLSRQIHVVVSQRLLVGCPVKSLVFTAPE